MIYVVFFVFFFRKELFNKIIVMTMIKYTAYEVSEPAKSRAINAMRASVVYVPTCQRCATYSTWRTNVLKGVATCQLRLSKGVPIFQLFF